MKRSIWSAFSSNHSASFTVVGVFSSPEHAQEASEILTALLRTIFDWYHKPENWAAREAWESGSTEPSPAELAIAQQLGIAWPEESLDWLWFDVPNYEPVNVMDNLVFIEGPESALGAHPADDLVRCVGGQPLISGSVGGPEEKANSLWVILNCTAPDEAAAEAIERTTSDIELNPDQYRDQALDARWPNFVGPAGCSIYEGTIHRTGRALVFMCTFLDISKGFPALLAYLRDRGCIDIRYEFIEQRDL
jgi:hypothetical protein